MNGPVFSSSDAWTLVGWTMVHFLWVGLVILLLAWTLRFVVRRASPTLRYLVAMTSLGLLSLAPVVLLGWLAAPRTAANRFQRAVAESVSDFFEVDGSSVIEMADSPRFSADFENSADFETASSWASRQPSPVASVSHDPLPRVELNVTRPDVLQFSVILPRVATRLVPWLPYVWAVGTPLTFLLLAMGLVVLSASAATVVPSARVLC